MRDASISISKGLAIILMVLAHTNFSHYGSVWINMFHMPLFFFFSGYCIKETYFDTPLKYIKRRIDGIYVPFVKWSILFLLLHNFFFYVGVYNSTYGGAHGGSVEAMLSVSEILKRIFYICVTITQKEHLLGGYWFLHTLFFSSIIAFGVLYLLRNKEIYKRCLMGGVILMSLIIISRQKISVPFFVIRDREIMAALFIMIGYYAKGFQSVIASDIWIVISSILFGICIVCLGTVYWPCSMTDIKYQYIIPYIITATFGTLAIFSISKIIAKSNNRISDILTYVGNHTLEVLTWHFLSFKLVSLFLIYVFDAPFGKLAEFPTILEYSKDGWWLLYLIVGVTIPLLLNKTFEQIRKRRTYV